MRGVFPCHVVQRGTTQGVLYVTHSRWLVTTVCFANAKPSGAHELARASSSRQQSTVWLLAAAALAALTLWRHASPVSSISTAIVREQTQYNNMVRSVGGWLLSATRLYAQTLTANLPPLLCGVWCCGPPNCPRGILRNLNNSLPRSSLLSVTPEKAQALVKRLHDSIHSVAKERAAAAATARAKEAEKEAEKAREKAKRARILAARAAGARNRTRPRRSTTQSRDDGAKAGAEAPSPANAAEVSRLDQQVKRTKEGIQVRCWSVACAVCTSLPFQ